jgi:hypothetical protein
MENRLSQVMFPAPAMPSSRRKKRESSKAKGFLEQKSNDGNRPPDVGERPGDGRKNSEYANLSIMADRQCRVTVSDVDGVDHTVTVEADSVYVAAARGFAEIKKHRWAAMLPEGLNRIHVLVCATREVGHFVQFANLVKWAKQGSRSPAEIIRRKDVKTALGLEDE